jgi:hypothetical protein
VRYTVLRLSSKMADGGRKKARRADPSRHAKQLKQPSAPLAIIVGNASACRVVLGVAQRQHTRVMTHTKARPRAPVAPCRPNCGRPS